MPSATHLVYGLSLVIPIMMIARDRINYKAAIIFILCNYIGPDSFYPYIFLPLYGHSILGYIVWAAFLAAMYSYISRFSISRNGLKFQIQDDGRIEVPYKQSYMLCLAGGISHFFIDMIGHHGFKLFLTQWDNYSLYDVLAWGDEYYHEFSVETLVSFVFILIIILLLFQVLQKEPKSQYLFVFGIMVMIIFLMLVFGGKLFAELEISMVFVIGLYILLPLTLLYKAFAEVNDYNQKVKSGSIEIPPRKFNVNTVFKSIIGFLSTLVLVLMIAGIIVLNISEKISNRYGYAQELFEYGSIAVIILAVILGILTLLLALKKEIARKSIIVICFLAFITVITMVIAFALSENEIKAYFKRPE